MRPTLFANLPLTFLQIRGCYQTLTQVQGFPISRSGEPYHKSSFNQSTPFSDLYASSFSHTVSSYQLIIDLWPSTYFSASFLFDWWLIIHIKKIVNTFSNSSGHQLPQQAQYWFVIINSISFNTLEAETFAVFANFDCFRDNL